MALRENDHRGPGRAGRRRRGPRGPRRRRGQRAAPRPAAPAGGPEDLGLAEYFQATGHDARRAAGRPCGSTPSGRQGRPGAACPGRGRGAEVERRGARRRDRHDGRADGHDARGAARANSTRPAGPARYARSCARPRRWSGCSTTWSSSTKRATRCRRDDLEVDAPKDDEARAGRRRTTRARGERVTMQSAGTG